MLFRSYLTEGKLYEAAKACPLPTQDLELNTKNRDSAIKADYIKYGPLNVDEPGDYWEKLAEHWDTTVEAAKQSLCANCAAFDISPRMEDCMPGPLQDEDGKRLKGYSLEIINDELLISDEDGILVDYNPNNKESQIGRAHV